MTQNSCHVSVGDNQCGKCLNMKMIHIIKKHTIDIITKNILYNVFWEEHNNNVLKPRTLQQKDMC